MRNVNTISTIKLLDLSNSALVAQLDKSPIICIGNSIKINTGKVVAFNLHLQHV